jgi:hypothetical protein
MQPNQKVAIWIHDEAAKLFLGLESDRPASRWAVVGTVLPEMESPIGVWVDVAHVEERRTNAMTGERTKVAWTVQPGQCLIRWDYIITAQVLAAAPTTGDSRPAPGFV